MLDLIARVSSWVDLLLMDITWPARIGVNFNIHYWYLSWVQGLSLVFKVLGLHVYLTLKDDCSDYPSDPRSLVPHVLYAH